jgi:hypothetical protein
VKTYKIEVSVRIGAAPPYKESVVTTEVKARSEEEAKRSAKRMAENIARADGERGSVTTEVVDCIVV